MNKIFKLTMIVFASIALVLQISSIYISNRIGLNSIAATKIQQNLEALKEKNMELESQLLTLAAYNTIASRAADLGYADNKEFVSLYDPVHVAIGR